MGCAPKLEADGHGIEVVKEEDGVIFVYVPPKSYGDPQETSTDTNWETDMYDLFEAYFKYIFNNNVSGAKQNAKTYFIKIRHYISLIEVFVVTPRSKV